MAKKLIDENKASPKDQEEYLKKYKKLEERHGGLVAKVTELENERTRKRAQIDALGLFLETYKKQPSFMAEWDPAIWLMTVEEAVVNKGKRIRFKFYTGAEIEVALD